MMTELHNYLMVLNRIAMVKGDDEFASTPYMLNRQRCDAHDALWNKLCEYLKFDDDLAKSDGYYRSKELFARLDKIFKLFNEWDLDLKNYDDLRILEKDLERFLYKREVTNYLEGKTSGIHNVIENE